MKKITTFIALTLISSFVGLNVANAAVFKWVGWPENYSIMSFINPQFIANEDIQKTNVTIDMLQGNSIIASNSPVALVRRGSPVVKTIVVTATAYSSTPDQTDHTPFITAMGTHVRDGIVAANFLPFGTKIKMPDVFGDKIFIVEDRMHNRYWHNVDIWFPERWMAREFGVKRVKVEII